MTLKFWSILIFVQNEKNLASIFYMLAYLPHFSISIFSQIAPQAPPKCIYQSFVFIYNSLIPIRYVSMLIAVGPPTGSWATYRRTHHQGKKDQHSILQQPSTANISQVGVGLCELLLHPCWNVYWLDIVQILCRQLHLLYFMSKMVQTGHVQKTLFLKQSSPPFSSYSLSTSSLIFPEPCGYRGKYRCLI